jgi:small acid-soluble spore protein (thioredoxin-like protein)
MKSNPDDRRDNVRRIQRNINHTIQNMEAADEMMSKTSDPRLKRALEEKNERRRASLESLRKEIKDEADFQAKKKS